MSNALNPYGGLNLSQRNLKGTGYFANLDRLKNLYEVEFKFRNLFSSGLTVWTNSATDASNIASGFDPNFRVTYSAGTPTQSVGLYGNLVSTSTSSTNDALVRPIAVAASTFLASTGHYAGIGDMFLSWLLRPTSIANIEIFAGAGNTVASAMPSSADNDVVGIIYNAASHANWRGVVVRSGSATYTDLGFAPSANTSYFLTTRVSKTGAVEFFINGTRYGSSSALFRTALDDGVSSVQMEPFSYIETKTGSAKTCWFGAYAERLDLLS